MHESVRRWEWWAGIALVAALLAANLHVSRYQPTSRERHEPDEALVHLREQLGQPPPHSMGWVINLWDSWLRRECYVAYGRGGAGASGAVERGPLICE